MGDQFVSARSTRASTMVKIDGLIKTEKRVESMLEFFESV